VLDSRTKKNRITTEVFIRGINLIPSQGNSIRYL
jgi:hypothetical protein